MSEKAAAKDRIAGFAAGVASGATKLIVGHPFDTVKIRMQVEGGLGRFSSSWDCLLSTIKRERFRGLYKGATPPLIGWSIMDAIQLGTLSNVRLLLQRGDKNKKLKTIDHALAGVAAGWTVALVATPVQSNGIKGLWYGLPATMIQRSFFFFLWGSYDLYSNWLRTFNTKSTFPYLEKAKIDANMVPIIPENRKVSEKLVSFIAGGLSATTFWTLVFPFDVVKNRYMTDNGTKYPSIRYTISYIYKTEGIGGFFKGFVPSFIRSFPTNACAVFVWDTTMRFMTGHGHN
ncbi:hypothetical protein BB561_001385 [Smittium simulii]|uniref:Mitochondrial carrier protein n=1 Tax=Smittium simulii TaxID=133385 RepID=A0A2T9YUV4_9FUNG|nr:hypothetical protein BB561_001385 [Smittium simulii]